MRIWVDADATPRPVRELLLRAAERRRVTLVLVANSVQRAHACPSITSVLVDGTFDAADRHIEAHCAAGDLVVTADVPLAAAVAALGAFALDPRGELITEAEAGERLAMRDLMAQLRGGAEQLGGPAAYSEADRRAFANALDRWIARRPKAP